MRTPGPTFNFNAHMDELVAHIAATCPELSHVDPSRVLTCAAQARVGGRRGVHARVVPLRFREGATVTELGKRLYRIPKVQYEGREILYLIYFYLPRFLEAPKLEDKLATVFHELCHISPECDGDLRRFPGRAYAHGPSRKRYHATARALAESYLATCNGHGLGPAWFLEHSFSALEVSHGPIVGRHVPMPKLHRIA